MSDIKLFQIQKANGLAVELNGSTAPLEKSLQNLIESNLDVLLGIRFLKSEHGTGPKHGGRIDTLGIDENKSPVIIEYKRSINENVINQGLFYLDWLMDHRAEFQLLVMDRLGSDAAQGIDWSAPRLLCIASNFTRYDEHAIQQINRNIELIRYRRFGDELLLLELVNATSIETLPTDPEDNTPKSNTSSKQISQVITELNTELRDLYEELRAFLLALGDDVQEKVLKYYIAFKRIKNFACVEVHPGIACVRVYIKVNPDDIELEPGFTRDVREVGHYGTGDLEITVQSRDDLDKAKDLLLKSYELS